MLKMIFENTMDLSQNLPNDIFKINQEEIASLYNKSMAYVEEYGSSNIDTYAMMFDQIALMSGQTKNYLMFVGYSQLILMMNKNITEGK